MKRGILIWTGFLALGVLSTGCTQFMTHSEQAEQAKHRWNHMRAKIKLQLAERSFETGAIDEAQKHCKEVLALDPTFGPGFLLAARIHLEKGEIGQAVAVLEGAELILPASAELAYLRGVVAERQGKMHEAVEHYAAAYELKPSDLDCLLGYVECLIVTDRIEEAVEVITPRRRHFEQTAAVHALTGQALTLLGRPTEAAECYRFAIDLAPNNALLREEAGLAFLEVGWYDDAVEALEPLVSVATPGPAATQPARQASISAVRALAVAYIASDRPGQAGTTLEKALAEEPHALDVSLWMLAANAWLRAGQIPKADVAARRAVNLAPDQTDAHLVMAYSALQTERIDEAIRIAKQLVERNPQDLEARVLLAKALEETPKGRAQAVYHYERILAIAPGHPWALTQLQRLSGQARLP